MGHVRPEQVVSPKSIWRLNEIILDRGAEDCAYALGEWNGEPRIGFRWNGSDDSPIGNPQSRGLPTWTMLDPELHGAVVRLLPPDKRTRARRFLGMGLRFDGVSLSEDRSSLLLWDVRQAPAIVAKVECMVIRDLIGDSMISEEECRLVADVNKELLTEVVEENYFQNRYVERDNGTRVVEIGRPELESVADRLSSTVLESAARARFVG